MISAWRIPVLTERMLAATLAAQEHQAQDTAEFAGVAPDSGSIELLLVERLERLGYRVKLERAVA